MSAEAKRCGLVALLGPPNAGKSSLLNALLKERLAIVAPKPQTTRLPLKGVLVEGAAQAVIVDTPGLIGGHNPMEWGMRSAALEAARDADLVLALTSFDTHEAWKTAAPAIKAPFIALCTKADAEGRARSSSRAEDLKERLGAGASLAVSALKGWNLDKVKAAILLGLPEGPWLFPEDELTDQTLRTAAAEFVREQCLMVARDEVPHSVAVGVDRYSERADGLHEVHCTLYVERESQKAILVGKGGERLKLIGTRARHRLEALARAKVFLKLWVKVAKDWKKDPRFLKELGYPIGKAPHAPKDRKKEHPAQPRA